uniref:MiT/TFE transcription factors N-terminal domain-containing protein n=1 Tax=Vespula pensylvanica TaxID=30213 RepID=A0A834K8S5_VESPE|nr:hypothetical protein H0235_015499 [Vespula pensylvanica]
MLGAPLSRNFHSLRSLVQQLQSDYGNVFGLSLVEALPPTFKTATPTSRTQLKLQLMREQLQEQERREAEFRQSLQQQRPAAAHPRPVPPTPLSTIGVDVPPQVLQVRTLLENPTRYHVVQKQKNQVRQYLQESFRGVDCGTGVNAVLGSAGNDSSTGGTPVDVGGIPSTAATSAPVPPAPVLPMVVHSAPPGPTVHHQKPQHPHLASYPRAPGLLSHGNPVSASPDPTTGAMSPGLSSVATSNSEIEFGDNSIRRRTASFDVAMSVNQQLRSKDINRY